MSTITVIRELHRLKGSGVERHDAIKTAASNPNVRKVISRMSRKEKEELLAKVYGNAGGNGGGRAPTAKSNMTSISTQSVLNEFESAVDEALPGAIASFSIWNYAVVMLYQFFLSFGVDLDFMALILLIIDGLSSPNVLIKIFTWYGLISYIVAFLGMSHKVYKAWGKRPTVVYGQVETMFKWYHVVPLTRVIGFIVMYSVEGSDKHSVGSDPEDDHPESAIVKLSHFNTMIVVNMLSTLTVSIPTLFIGISRLLDGGMTTNELVICSFALFQAGTSLTISLVSMTLPGWTRKCIDVVSEAEKIEERKIADRANRTKLLQYYSKLRSILMNLVRDLKDDDSSARKILTEVKDQDGELRRIHDQADPIEREVEILDLLQSVVNMQVEDPDLDENLKHLYTDLKVKLRQVNQKVIEQKLVLEHPLTPDEKKFNERNQARLQNTLMM